MTRFSFLLAAAALAAMPVTSLLGAASEAEAAVGRELVKRYADAVVGVELVVTIRSKRGDREAPPLERRIEVNGTVISPSGLTVTSLSQVDPQTDTESLRARGVELVGTEFKEVKLRLADGREVPARFILKDADLDLAFMAPEPGGELPAGGFPSVKLEDTATASLMESLYYVARAPKTLQRIPLVRRTDVMGILEKPRQFYLLTDQSLGVPVFNSQGKILGVSLLYYSNGQRAATVVLPAADIAEMAKQAAAEQAAPKPGN